MTEWTDLVKIDWALCYCDMREEPAKNIVEHQMMKHGVRVPIFEIAVRCEVCLGTGEEEASIIPWDFLDPYEAYMAECTNCVGTGLELVEVIRATGLDTDTIFEVGWAHRSERNGAMGDWADELTLRAMIDDRIEDDDYDPAATDAFVPVEVAYEGDVFDGPFSAPTVELEEGYRAGLWGEIVV